jgi:hypothetical protein
VTTPDGQRTGGRFVQLLAEIYRKLRIKAKADSQARAAIEHMEKNSSKSDP